MSLKYLILLLVFIGFTFQGCSQDFKVIFDEETLPVKKDSAFINENKSITNDIIRALIVEKAREYIGVGYRYGQLKEDGFDCSGFVCFVFGNFGYTLPHSSYEQYKKSSHLKAKKAQPGDLVFFSTRGSQISHVGIYLGNNAFIHSPSSGKKVCIDSLGTDYYKKHLVGFGTFLQ
jgi:cell wall-associated NlpC family hydrolase